MLISKMRCLYYITKIPLLLSLHIKVSLLCLFPYKWSQQCPHLFLSEMMTDFSLHQEQANFLVGVRSEEIYLFER